MKFECRSSSDPLCAFLDRHASPNVDAHVEAREPELQPRSGKLRQVVAMSGRPSAAES